jgi:hypothetical protein
MRLCVIENFMLPLQKIINPQIYELKIENEKYWKLQLSTFIRVVRVVSD